MSKVDNFRTNQLYALIDNKALRKERQAKKLSVGSVISVDEAQTYNEEGYAIYWTPNTMKKISKLTEHTDDNVTHLNFFFVDIDFIDPLTQEKYTEDKRSELQGLKNDKMNELLDCSLRPTMIVETKNGVQAYWRCAQVPANESNVEKYKRVQKGLVDFFGGDDNAMNRSRFLRYPNYNHLKDPNKPYRIRLVYTADDLSTYSTDQMLQAFPIKTAPVKEEKKVIVKEVKLSTKKDSTTLTIEEAKERVKPYLKQYIESKYGVDASPKHKFSCITPNHNDSTPSMEYFEDSNKVFCYGCDTSWDFLDLIASENGLDVKRDFITVLEKACNICGYKLDKDKKTNSPKTKEKPIEKAKKEEEPEEEKVNYNEYFESLPYATSDTTTYLTDRGLSDSIIKRYDIRYDSQCERFFGEPAIIFPRGSYSYNARTVKTDAPKDKRYRRNEGHADIFNMDALEGLKPIVITEGEIDSMSVIEASNNRVDSIALGGVTFHRKFIKYLEEEEFSDIQYPLIIALDNDKAGDKGAEKFTDALTKLNIPFIIANLQGDKCKDINEALLNDRGTLESNIDKVLKECVSMLYTNDITKNKGLKKELAPASSYLADFELHIKERAKTDVIPTGYPMLDEILDGGLRTGLYFIGAPPSLGKTTFCLQMADQIAKSGNDVIFFSLEQSKDELISKSLSRETLMQCNGDTRNAKTAIGISSYKRYENYSQRELELIDLAKKRYSDYARHIHIFEATEQVGVHEIRKQVETLLKFKRPLSPEGYKPVVFIDYLQILKPADIKADEKKNNDIAITELKRISRDYSLTVIGISSYNRDNYKRKANMSAFKETGSIEYGCDVLMGLQLEGIGGENYDENELKSESVRRMELAILKNRNGALPRQNLLYEFHTMFNFYDERPM